MKRTPKFFCCLLACGMSLLSVNSMADEIRLSAGGAPVDSIVKPVTPAFEKATGDRISLIFGGATISFKTMDRGGADVALAGTAFDDLIASLKKESYDIKDKSLYHSEVIGKSVLYIALNKENPLQSLTGDQIKGIFTGKIQNWKEVGGNDEPIMVVVSTQNPATMGAFKKLALTGEDFLKDSLDTPTFAEMTNMITSNPGAIGFGPFSIGDGNKLPKIPAYERPVIAITKGKPSAKVSRLLTFITGAGQKYVKP